MGKSEKGAPPPAPAAPFNAAFAGLAAKVAAAPAALPAAAAATPGAAVPAAAPAATAVKPARPPPARAVVRMERAGRRGKTVTVVEKLGLPPRQLDEWLGDLKRSLGCGGALEGGAIVLQGDLRERAARLLEARGVRKVTVA
jgi:translation initiation factor 1